MKTFSSLLNLAALGACLSIISNSHAQNTWKNAPDGNFSWNGFNWDSPLSWNDGDDAIFGPAGIGAITLGIPVIAHNLTFNSPGYSISGSTLTLGGTTPTITANENISISSSIAGGSGLTLQGGSNLTLQGVNTFTNGTYVNSGTLILKTLLGVNGTTAYTVDRIEAIDAGALVQIGTFSDGITNIRPADGVIVRRSSPDAPTSGRLNLTGGTFDNNGDNNGIQYPPPTGTGTILNSSPYIRGVLKLVGIDGHTYAWDGQIKDGGPLAQTALGVAYQQNVDMQGASYTYLIGGSNSFTGFWRFSSGGQKVIMQPGGTLGYPTPIFCPARQILMNSGTLDLNGTSQRLGYVFTGNDANSKITNGAIGTVSTLTVCFNCTNQVPFNGAATPRGIRSSLLDNPATGGTLALTKEGTAIQPIGNYSGDGSPAPNNYHGDTTVNNGILQVLSIGGISSNSVYRLNTTQGTLQLAYTGIADVKGLVIDGVAKPNGIYGSSTAPITGSGFLRVSNDRFLITQVGKNPSFDLLTITWDSLPGLTYAVEYSTDLGAHWFTQDGGSNVPSQGNSTTFDINFAESGFIYRVLKQ